MPPELGQVVVGELIERELWRRRLLVVEETMECELGLAVMGKTMEHKLRP